MPLPLRFTTLEAPLLELLVKVNFPDAAPVAAGSNCTRIVMAMFGFSVTGNVAPEKVNPAPVMLAPLTVTADVPVEVRVSDWLVAVPTGSFPKLKLALLKLSTGLLEFAPVPLRATVAVPPFVELLDTVMVPLTAPVTVGAKLTCRLSDCPGLRVAGHAAPDIVKPVPERAAELIVTGAVPDELNVSICVEVVFSVTLPNARVVALTVN